MRAKLFASLALGLLVFVAIGSVTLASDGDEPRSERRDRASDDRPDRDDRRDRQAKSDRAPSDRPQHGHDRAPAGDRVVLERVELATWEATMTAIDSTHSMQVDLEQPVAGLVLVGSFEHELADGLDVQLGAREACATGWDLTQDLDEYVAGCRGRMVGSSVTIEMQLDGVLADGSFTLYGLVPKMPAHDDPTKPHQHR